MRRDLFARPLLRLKLLDDFKAFQFEMQKRFKTEIPRREGSY